MTGIVINADDTATLTIDASDVALLPLGAVGLHLTIWARESAYTGSMVNAVVPVLDSSLAGATSTATWTGAYVVTASEATIVSGSQFVTTLTIYEDGFPLAGGFLAWVDWRLTHSPEGSSSPIELQLVMPLSVGGFIRYHAYALGTTPIWPGVTVKLLDSPGRNLLGTKVTDSRGAYFFLEPAAAGTKVVISVDPQKPPTESLTQNGESSPALTLVDGPNTIDLTCTGAT